MSSRPWLVPAQPATDRPVDPARKQPYPPKPKNIVPHKAKALTIAAAFPCKEGFVFCADQLMAHGTHTDLGSFAHYERKVFARRGDYYCALLCGAGPTGLLKTLEKSFFLKLKEGENKGEGLSVGEVQPILESVLSDLSEKVDDVDDFPSLSSLVAVMDDDGVHKYLRSDGQIVRPADKVEILGIGETSLVNHLTHAYRPDFTIKQTTALAAFVVYSAKRYCPQYCGGDTDIYTLFNGEFICQWEIVEKLKIESLERLFKRTSLDQLLQLVDLGAKTL